MFCDSKPKRQEEEEGHEDEVAPSGPLRLDTEQHHTAQDKFARDGHHGGELRQRMKESHPEGDEIIIHCHAKADRIDSLGRTGKQEQASQEDADNF